MEIITLEYTDIFDNNKTKEINFSKHLINNEFKEESLFALLVDGKSMEPTIKDKSIIVVDLSQKRLLKEAIYILYYENKMWVKKYDLDKNNFVSINPKFSNLIYKVEDCHIVGKVLITFTNL